MTEADRSYGKVAVLVLGMHRSGTSALTRVASLLGADLPKNLMPAGLGNDAGHWESQELADIHEALLASAATEWHDWRAFNPDWNASAAAEPFKQKILGVLEKDFAASSLFVIKDPRICRFVPIWLDVLSRFGAAPVVVTPLRNPMEVAGSLAHRDGLPPAKSYLLWLRHVLDAEAATRMLPRAFVNYEDVLNDWRAAIAAISARTGLHWPRRSDRVELEIDSFLAAELRHHNSAPAQLAARSDIAAWVKESYATLRQMAAEGDSDAARARLDKVREAFDAAAAAFGLLLAAETARSRSQAAAAEAQVKAKDEELARLSDDRNRLSAELDTLKPALDELLQVKSRVAAGEESLAQARNEIAAARDEAARYVQDRDRLAAEVEAAKAALAELPQLRGQIGTIEEALTQARSELDAAREETGRHSGERERLSAELQTVTMTLTERATAIARLTSELDAAGAAIAHTAKERDAARLYLRESQAEVQKLAGELDAAREDVARGKTERARMESDTLAMAREFTIVRTRVRKLQTDIESHGAAAAAARDGHRAALAAHDAALAEAARLKARTAELSAALDAARNLAASQEQRLDELEREMGAERAQVARAEAEIARLRSETAESHRLLSEREAKAKAEASAAARDLALARALVGELETTVAAQARHLAGGGAAGGANGAARGSRGFFGAFAARLARGNATAKAARAWEHEAIRTSRLFDAVWYLKRNPDVAAADTDPLWHYLLHGAAEGREPHPLFDTAFYRAQAPDLADSGMTPLAHYICVGVARGLDPHPLFDTDWYLQQNPDVAAAHVNPLYHFYKIGGALGLDPHPDFDSSWYLEQNPDVARVRDNPLHHYLVHGAKEGRDIRPGSSDNSKKKFYTEIQTIALSQPGEDPDLFQHETDDEAHDFLKRSKLFDARWYLSQYPDVKDDPLLHFLAFGAAERRNPNPLFDVGWYLEQYPDVATTGMNPLAHYLRQGAAAGYNPHPMFHTSWYLSKYPEVAKSGANPLVHFLTSGAALKTDPNPSFSMTAYFRQNPDAEAAGENALLHFLRHGALPPKIMGVPRLQIFRRGALGDVLLLTPAIKALRLDNPDAEIVVVTSCPELLENNPHINHVVAGRVPIDGCDETFMMDYESTPESHVVVSYARILNVSVSDRTPEIFIRNDERFVAAETLRKVGIEPGLRFCVMQITARWAVKNWPTNRFKEIAQALERDGVRVVILGDETNTSIDFGVDLRGETSIRLAAAIIEKCSLMVVLDSGLMHIGIALRRPIVSLFGCTDPNKLIPEWALSTALFSDVPCRGCHHRQPPPATDAPICIWNTVRCMEELSAAKVIEKARAELGTERAEHTPASWRDIVEQSGLFDANWYLTKYKDIARAKVDPFTHYIEFGARELRSPGPGFDQRWYKREYPEVAASGLDPLTHFLTVGKAKGYEPMGSSYEKWCAKFDTLSLEDRALIAADIASQTPVFMDVLLAISPGNQDFMGEVIQSIAGQLFAHWRAWITVDHRCRPSVLHEAQRIARSDSRFRILDGANLDEIAGKERRVNLLLVGGSAVLREHALYMFHRAIRDNESVELAYSDEDLIDRASQERSDPIFKPQFSPLLLSQTNYIGNCFLVRGDADTLRLSLNNPFDTDALIEMVRPRLTRSNTSRIPSILFHEVARQLKPRRPIQLIEADSTLPRFSIIIPTRDRLELLQPCIESIEQRTSYPSEKIEIIVVDNGSTDDGILRFLSELQRVGRARVLRDDGPFNFSRLNNLGAAEANYEVLLLLNNDTIVDDPLWLRRIATQVIQPDVAAVGGKLLYPDRTIQHAGVVLGVQGVGAHNLVGFDVDDSTILNDMSREMAAVTGACLAMRRDVYHQLGGLDPKVAVAFNDTLLCAAALNAGYRNIYIKEPLLIHFESKSRGYDNTPERRDVFQQEVLYARQHFNRHFLDDPYYSPNLCLQQINELAFPPRKSKPWRRAQQNLVALRILVLGACRQKNDLIAEAIGALASYLRDRGHRVYVGGPRAEDEILFPGCQRAYVNEPEETAVFAVAEGIDCIVATANPFFSVVRWLSGWPRTVFVDAEKHPPQFASNLTDDVFVDWEKQFCFLLASRVCAIRSPQVEDMNASEFGQWLVKLESIIVDACKTTRDR